MVDGLDEALNGDKGAGVLNPADRKKIQEKNARRPSRAKEPTGPVHPREMTQIRDEVGSIRSMVREWIPAAPALAEAHDRLDQLFSKLDRLDLRFKLNHDPSTKRKK